MRDKSTADLELRLEAIYAKQEMASKKVLFPMIKNMFRLIIALDENRVVLRLLSDANIDDAAKRVLLKKLCQGDSALEEVMAKIASQDFGSEHGFLSALEDIAVDGTLYSAQQDGKLDLLEEEMYAVQELLAHETDLNKMLSDAAIPRESRLQLVDSLFRDKVDMRTFALLKHSTGYLAQRRFLENVYWIANLISVKKNKIVAHIASSFEWTESQKDRLKRTLEKRFGQEIEIAIELQPDLIGGARIQIGPDYLDSSIESRLKEFVSELKVGV